MITTLLILGCILFAFICINIGYKIAIKRYNPQMLIDGLKTADEYNKKMDSINRELSLSITKSNETINANQQWYLLQIQHLAKYLKDKHNDNYIYDQMKGVSGFEIPKEELKLTIDDILDKISKYGFESLNDDERKFLKYKM